MFPAKVRYRVDLFPSLLNLSWTMRKWTVVHGRTLFLEDAFQFHLTLVGEKWILSSGSCWGIIQILANPGVSPAHQGRVPLLQDGRRSRLQHHVVAVYAAGGCHLLPVWEGKPFAIQNGREIGKFAACLRLRVFNARIVLLNIHFLWLGMWMDWMNCNSFCLEFNLLVRNHLQLLIALHFHNAVPCGTVTVISCGVILWNKIRVHWT